MEDFQIDFICQAFFRGDSLLSMKIDHGLREKLVKLQNDYKSEIMKPGCSGCIKKAAVRKYTKEIHQVFKNGI